MNSYLWSRSNDFKLLLQALVLIQFYPVQHRKFGSSDSKYWPNLYDFFPFSEFLAWMKCIPWRCRVNFNIMRGSWTKDNRVLCSILRASTLPFQITPKHAMPEGSEPRKGISRGRQKGNFLQLNSSLNIALPSKWHLLWENYYRTVGITLSRHK